jgi:prepilin-type N-terminal cleavage/methylation domain-containing protein
MDAGPARRRSAGFSLAELVVTLVVLGLAAWLVLRLVDRRTRVRSEPSASSGPEGVLDAAFRMLLKDVRAAGTGGLPADEAIRPVADNTPPADEHNRVRTVHGDTVAVRPGTDQMALRGVLRTPLLRLEPGVPGTGETVSDAMRARPSNVTVRAAPSPDLAAVRARLVELSGSGKAFFLVSGAASRWAVARVASVAAGAADGPMDVVLDFTDADARARNRGGEPDAASRLDGISAGGVFDDLVWFVALGPEGHPPDFERGSDPESLHFPHPYLAYGVAAGEGRWDVHEVGGDIEDLQIAWGLAGPPGALEWRAEAPGSAAPRIGDLVDTLGRPRLRSLRIAMVARAGLRLPRSEGSPPPEFDVPLNGPAPGAATFAGPIGWDRSPRRRIRFDREVREELVSLPSLAETRR